MPAGYSFLGDFRVQEAGGELVSQSIGNKALKTSVCDSSTLEVDSATGELRVMQQGGSLANGIARNRMSKYAGTWIQGDLATTTGVGGIFQLTNSYGSDLIVTDVLINVTTATSAGDGSYVDIGAGSSLTTNYPNLIDGLDITSTGVASNLTDAGTSGGIVVWESGEYINATGFDSGGTTQASTNLVGNYAIHVIDISS